MLRGNNDHQLIEKGIHKEVVPFYQIWQELVHEKTLDVYQYRVLTSLSAMKELTDVLKKTINGLFNSDANIEACREEMLHILEHDRIMGRHFKAILNRIQFNLLKCKEKEISGIFRSHKQRNISYRMKGNCQ